MGHPIAEEHNRIVGEKVVAALQKNGFTAAYFDTLEEAKKHVLATIADRSSVGFGGSATVVAMDLQPALKEKGCTLHDHAAVADPAEKYKTRRMQLQSDYLLTGTNAITIDGKLYNVDATGNRVAAMTFGPEHVIVVAGVNKVVPDLAAADARVRQFAAPRNNLRYKTGNPCTECGYCVDCRTAKRLCNIAVTLHRKPGIPDFQVLIVGEEAGF